MITENDIDSAVNFLHRKANSAAEARAQHDYLDDMGKVLLAKLASESGGKSEAEKQRLALTSDEYQTHLDGLREARERDHTFRNKRAAAIAKIDCWRTMQASRRGADRVG